MNCIWDVEGLFGYMRQILEAAELQANDEGLWSVPAEGTQPIREAYLNKKSG